MENGKKSQRGVRGSVNWEAEEYIQAEKSGGWYVGLAVITGGLVLASVFLKWWTFTALVLLSAVAIFMYAKRPPRVLHYSLSSKGLSEGNKLYGYEDFKSFGVILEGVKPAIVLTPRKRFASRVTAYFPKEQGEEIVDALGAKLPMEEVKLDFLDKIVKILRF
ncbi:hypothetical protein IJH89_00195 [Candidatus Saccharibacteria bacterium]|nr:hypothetical protein [Candidatus Saccharibacteria bacterium]